MRTGGCSATGWTLPTVRMYYNAFFEQLKDELQQGHNVITSGESFVVTGEEPNAYRFAATHFTPMNKGEGAFS